MLTELLHQQANGVVWGFTHNKVSPELTFKLTDRTRGLNRIELLTKAVFKL